MGGPASGVQDGGRWIWTSTRTERITRESAPRDERSVNMSAARNEWESFQILVRSSVPIEGINITAGDLAAPYGAVIKGQDARLYREHQIYLKQSSGGRGGYGVFRPGWYADGLIPFEHPLTRRSLPQAKYRAVPFDLPAGQTHGFWIDIYVPADAKPGTYQGTYRVVSKDATLAEIPVRLAVWDFELPRFSALRTDFDTTLPEVVSSYTKAAKKPKESIDWKAVAEQFWDLSKRHHINAIAPDELRVPAAKEGDRYRFTDAQIAALREFIDRYNVNAVRIGNPIGHAKAVGTVLTPEREAVLKARLAAYDDAYRKVGRPEVIFYTYLLDEPGSEATYRFVRTWGRAIREAKSPVQVMVTEQTTPEKDRWGSLAGAVDIWCPVFTRFNPQSAARRQALGETIWTYTCMNWWQIDYPLIAFRAPAWTAWHFGIRGLLYWDMMHWREVQDPWTDPATKTNPADGGKRNGEGSLLYPANDVGFDGVVPSIRLKAIRDSIEDYDYLVILEKQGRASEARAITSRLIGRYSAKWGPFMKPYADSKAHEEARGLLAEMILRGASQSSRRPGQPATPVGAPNDDVGASR